MDRAHQVYPSSSECMVVLFDLRIPGAAERLGREHAAWRDSADVERLDAAHAVLVMRPGGALRVPR